MDIAVAERDETQAQCLFERHQQEIFRRTDHLFAGLMTFQWLAGIVAALWISDVDSSTGSSVVVTAAKRIKMDCGSVRMQPAATMGRTSRRRKR